MPEIEIPAATLRGAGGWLYAHCHDEEALLVGPAGSGKSVAALKKLVTACSQYPGSRHLLCRQTRKSLTDSSLITLESIIGENHPEVIRVSREQRHSYRLYGSEIVCAGLDEPSKAYGTAWGIVVLEEAIEAELGAWELFARSARDPRMRSGGQGKSFPYHQRIAVTNPSGPSHWLNERATPCDDVLPIINSREDYKRAYDYSTGLQQSKMRRLLSVHQDNPTMFTPPADPSAWASGWTEEGKKYLASLEGMSGHRRAWMKLGLWRQPSGVVFPEWDPTIHVCDDFESPPDWPMVVAMDPGFGTCGVLWIALSPDGGFYVVDGIYEGGKSIAQHCEEILRRNKQHGCAPMRYLGDPNEMFSNRAQGPSCAAQARNAGIQFVPWPADKGSAFDAGVEAIRTFLNNASKRTPYYLQVCRRVKGLQSNFSSWGFKKNRSGEVPAGADKYEESSDHHLDPLRGAIQSNLLQRMHLRSLEPDPEPALSPFLQGRD